MYRACIVGTGSIAAAHARAYDATDVKRRASLVAVQDIDRDRAAAFAEENGITGVVDDLDELLEHYSPDLVHICTPPALHVDQTLRALRAGAWVLCEKPMVGSLADLDRIAAAEGRAGSAETRSPGTGDGPQTPTGGEAGPYAASVFQFRFSRAAEYLREAIAERRWGPPTVSVCHTLWYRGDDYYEVPWRGTFAQELGGPTVGHGIHAMDLYLHLMGDWVEVRAMAETVQRRIETEDVSTALVRFADGSVGSVVNSVLSPRQRTYLRFDFSDATVEAEGLYRFDNDNWSFTARDGASPAPWNPGADRPGDHAAQLTALLDDMDAGRRPHTSGAGLRRTTEFITAIYKSSRTGCTVERGSISQDDPFYRGFAGLSSTAG